jgi:hypothetical protein
MADVTIHNRGVEIGLSVDLKNKEGENRFNYIVEIQKLVAQILTELGRISANDHESIEKMKNKFMDATLKHAGLQTDYGRVNRNMSIASFAVFSVRLFLPNIDDRELVQILSNQLPSLGGMYTSGLQSQMHKANAEGQLELEKYRTKTAAKQSDGNAKQDYLSLLQSVGENLKSASRANG